MNPMWNRLVMLFSLAPSPRVHQALVKTITRMDDYDMARRWNRARLTHPELMSDVIRLGGVLAAQPMQGGEVQPLDATRLSYEAGRRDLALQLLAMMQMSIEEFNLLTEKDDE